MQELIKETLNQYFSEFKNYQVIILIVFTLIIAAIQIFQTIWVARMIEKFKTVLKINEIKFSRYHNLQVDSLKSIYNKLVLFHGANISLFKSKYDTNNHSHFKSRINYWIKTYIECVNEFSHEKILLPNNLKILVQRTLVDFEIVKDILIQEKDYLECLEGEANGCWTDMYDFAENELSIINEKINNLKSKPEIDNCEINIKELRKSIEDYFEEMIK